MNVGLKSRLFLMLQQSNLLTAELILRMTCNSFQKRSFFVFSHLSLLFKKELLGPLSCSSAFIYIEFTSYYNKLESYSQSHEIETLNFLAHEQICFSFELWHYIRICLAKHEAPIISVIVYELVLMWNIANSIISVLG